MQVQYIYDENGKNTGVILPIDLWQDLSPKIQTKKERGSFEPSKFRGIYRNLEIHLKKELENLRQEWELV